MKKKKITQVFERAILDDVEIFFYNEFLICVYITLVFNTTFINIEKQIYS